MPKIVILAKTIKLKYEGKGLFIDYYQCVWKFVQCKSDCKHIIEGDIDLSLRILSWLSQYEIQGQMDVPSMFSLQFLGLLFNEY